MAYQRIAVSPAKILNQRTYLAPGKLEITQHTFSIPSSHANPTSTPLSIFARSIRRPTTSTSPPTTPPKWLVYLNGGPGLPCRLPDSYPFVQPLLDRDYTLLLLDQRGTGLSTPLTASTLQQRGDEDVQVAHAKLYRADSIVRDCEAIRLALLPSDQKWSLMGQSFGGFASMTYLSFYPEALREVFVFGGLAPLLNGPDEAYRKLYRRLEGRNRAYYEKFPEDVERVREIVGFLVRFGDGKVRLPGGGRLTARRFMQLGTGLGFHGGVDSIHDIVLKATTDIKAFGHLTRPTLSAIESFHGWDDVLIYSMLHEPIYCQGTAPNWAAHRLAQKEFPRFGTDRLTADALAADSKEPLLFTGEMIFPWMFTDCSELEKVQGVAERLAADSDWSPLYDENQLARNEVPVYAAVYTEDMYVDYDLSMTTASKIKGCKVFSTNVMYHNAVREKSKEVLDQLFALRDDVID